MLGFGLVIIGEGITAYIPESGGFVDKQNENEKKTTSNEEPEVEESSSQSPDIEEDNLPIVEKVDPDKGPSLLSKVKNAASAAATGAVESAQANAIDAANNAVSGTSHSPEE